MATPEDTTVAIPEWGQLTQEQKDSLKSISQKQWDELDQKQRKALADFALIGEVLAVPTSGQELPSRRKWTLPDPEEEALLDAPRSLNALQGQSAVPAKSQGQGTQSYGTTTGQTSKPASSKKT